MSTYQLLHEFFFPLFGISDIANANVGLYGGLNSGCDNDKSVHESSVGVVEGEATWRVFDSPVRQNAESAQKFKRRRRAGASDP